jgi:hypothetical protein
LRSTNCSRTGFPVLVRHFLRHIITHPRDKVVSLQ